VRRSILGAGGRRPALRCKPIRTVQRDEADPCETDVTIDPATLLRLLSLVVVGTMAVGALRSPSSRRAEAFLVVTVVAALGAVTLAVAPAYAPLTVLLAAPILGILPARLEQLSLRALLEGRRTLATGAARLASLLRPIGPIGHLGRDMSTLVAARLGGVTPALLDRLADPRQPERGAVLVTLAQHVGGDAHGIRVALAIPSRRKRALASGLGLAWIRAVARTAGPDEILLALEEVEREDPTFEEPARRAAIALEVSAALGDREGVERLLAVLRGRLPNGEATRVRSEAALADGDRIAARQAIEGRAGAVDPEVARALSDLLARAGRLGPRVSSEHRARAVRCRDEALAVVALAPLGHAWASATVLLTAALVGWHLIVVRTGEGDDLRHLLAMGGLRVPIGDARGALHVLTVPLVHAGPVHLALNVLALLGFGPWVERLLGRGRMVVVFVCATVVSSLAVAALASPSRPTVLVGASGAIFGLGGAMGAVLLTQPHLRRTRRAQEVLRGFGAMLALQFVVDRLVPMVSGTAHVAGLVAGALSGLILVRRPTG